MDADRPYRLAAAEPGPDGHAAPWLVEIPIHWGLDDWEQYAYLPDLTGSGLIESPAKVMEMWRLERDATFAAGGCLVLTMHPFLSGRPSRAAALAGFLDELAGAARLGRLGRRARRDRGPRGEPGPARGAPSAAADPRGLAPRLTASAG